MPATKALLWFVLLGTGAAIIFFVAFPKYQPGVLKSFVRDNIKGFTPAATPSEAMEKFRECIRKRDYESAGLYTAGPYAEYLKMAAEPAAKLGEAVDNLAHNVDEVGINSPDGKYVLNRLEPFPKDFKFTVKQPVSDKDYKVLSLAFPDAFPADSVKTLSDKVAVGQITMELIAQPVTPSGRLNSGSFDKRIFLALVPIPDKWDGLVGLKKEGNEKEESWKIYIPMTQDIREKVDYLKQNSGNYVRGLDNVKYSIKHDAATKNDFEAELSKQLVEAK